MTRFHASRTYSGGFTLIEFIIVGALMALLGVLLSAAWAGLGEPMTDVLARCRVAQEANLAAAALARDFGSSLADSLAGDKQSGRTVGRLVVDGSELRLCFDGGSTPNGVADWASPDTVVTYEVQSNKLIRSDLQSGNIYTVAGNVDSMELVSLANGVQIRLSFGYRGIHRTFTMIGKDP